ncbi:hypothetical protein AB0L40_11730 [Patulibacter sp. NPDC049589]|uniref:DUF6923 family protein n=1 Tax=Patulibacter sp. NPDC049589 TaxID=3154731 RepID=UPI0034237E36
MPRSRRLRRRVGLAVALVSGALAGLAGAAPALAAPGSPGVPGAPATVYTENFENGTGTTAVALENYVGAPPLGAEYTAAATPAGGWLSAGNTCNGIILSNTFTGNGGIACANYPQIRTLAATLGALNGSAVPDDNHVVSAYTANDPGVDSVEFRTTTDIPLAATTKRFLTFSVNAAAINCKAGGGGGSPSPGAPLYKFYLVDPAAPGVEVPTFTQPINPCPAVGGSGSGEFPSDGSVLFDGSSVGIVMRNGNGSGIGNDAAFDDIKILDVTPQLDQKIGPVSTVSPGGTSTLTYTITNTSEKAAKTGWSFSDELGDGLEFVGTPTTTCSVGTPVVAGGTLSMSGGALDAGQTSCTVTITVKANAAGPHDSVPSDFSVTGLDLPAKTTLTVVPPVACSVSTAFVAQNAPTQLNALKYGSGSATFVPVGPAGPSTYNAIGYNPKDGLIYGIDGGGSDLVQVDGTGAVHDLGSAGAAAANAGAFDADGTFYTTSSAATTLYATDVVALTSTSKPLTQASTADFSFVGTSLWGAATYGGAAKLVRTDPATGTVTRFDQTALPDGVGPGAAWTFVNGDLGLSDNATGKIYRVRITNPDGVTPTFKLISVTNGPATTNNDGTSCTGDPVDLGIEKTTPAAVDAGGTITWTLTVTNRSATPSSGYTVTDDAPAGVTAVATTTPGCSVTGGTVTCTEGELAAGASFVVTVTGQAPGTYDTKVTNTASVLGNEPDPAAGNDSATADTTTSSPPEVVLNGPDPGTKLTVGGKTPVDFDCRKGAAPLDCTGTVTLPDGSTVSVPDGSDLPTTIPGVYTITAQVVDALGTTKTVTRTYEVFAPPTVTIGGPADGGRIDAGTPTTGTFTCDAPAGLGSCTATVTLPDGSVVPLADGGALPTTVPGTYTITAKVIDALGVERTVTKTYVVVAPPAPAPPAPPAKPAPAPKPAPGVLAVTKSVSKKTLRPGQSTLIKVRVRNTGGTTLRNVRICEAIPAGLQYVSAKPKSTLEKGQRCWTIKTLKPGQSASVTYRARALNRPGRVVTRSTGRATGVKADSATAGVRILRAPVRGGGVTG